MSTDNTSQPQATGGGTSTTGPVTAKPSLEDKILLAAQESERVIAIFRPTWAALVAEGVALEPIVSCFAQTIASIFHHHTGVRRPLTKQ